MKIEIGNQKPDHFTANWPGEYDVFSHFEFACGIPHPLFAITTIKENGKPNVCFGSWTSFTGDGGGYYAITSCMQRTHTYQNILRTKEFVINFLSKEYFDACVATIRHNDHDADEFEVGHFTIQESKTVASPRIEEAFLNIECSLQQTLDLSGNGRNATIIGKVNHIAMQEEYATGIDDKYGENGFMFNINSPKNLITGEGQASAVAVCKVALINEEG
ncbi:MAG: flavin reductase family protein [Clostridiales bacterium]|nr:flavin reductase family protein [Clostridiales bacterium]